MNPEEWNTSEQAITGTFMWSFKKGDNIIYNLAIIWDLYKAKDLAAGGAKRRFIKPIIMLQMSIIECIMDDFVNRVVGHVSDTVPNITTRQIEDFRTKKRDKLEHYINAARKHNLFDAPDTFYTQMHLLRNARNRFHIQNTKYMVPANEYQLFTEGLLTLSEQVFEKVLETMMTKFYRWGKPGIAFAQVPLPWSRQPQTSPSIELEQSIWICPSCCIASPSHVAYCLTCGYPNP